MIRVKQVHMKKSNEDRIDRLFCPACGTAIYIHLDMTTASHVKIGPHCPNRRCASYSGLTFEIVKVIPG